MPEPKQGPASAAPAAAAPEPLAAIAHEIRTRAFQMFNEISVVVKIDTLKEWASRIEAAAERERDEADERIRNAWTEGYCMDPDKSAPGNATAMREALENARSKFIHIKKCADEGEVSRKKLAILCEFVSQEITAALSAPPRNCDRFQSGDRLTDAVSSLNAYANEEEHESVRRWNESDWRRFLDWLFAMAKKGGAE